MRIFDGDLLGVALRRELEALIGVSCVGEVLELVPLLLVDVPLRLVELGPSRGHRFLRSMPTANAES